MNQTKTAVIIGIVTLVCVVGIACIICKDKLFGGSEKSVSGGTVGSLQEVTGDGTEA